MAITIRNILDNVDLIDWAQKQEEIIKQKEDKRMKDLQTLMKDAGNAYSVYGLKKKLNDEIESQKEIEQSKLPHTDLSADKVDTLLKLEALGLNGSDLIKTAAKLNSRARTAPYGDYVIDHRLFNMI